MSFTFNAYPPFQEQGCCDEGCGCVIENPQALISCPLCGEKGEKVSNLTVYSLTQKEHKSDIDRKGSDHYNVCMTPECSCAYYNEKGHLTTSQMKRDFDFKDDKKEHFVCYCLNITKPQIIETIKSKKLTGMQDIMKELVGPPPCACEKNNPTGLCCDAKFNTIIKEFLAQN